ncbi:MAG: hypothetical protein JSS66_09980 [Armatimonadetes bacterium]|nr:hypothetical protein [Armatimonadota bacterium]
MKQLVCLFAVAFVLGGCTKGPDTPAGPKGTPPAGSETKGGTATGPSIPADLKHEAYAYNGFERTKGLKYLISRIEGEKPEEGTQVSEFKGLANGAATYLVKRQGSLLFMGDEELIVKPDGVYLSSSAAGSPKQPIRVMPAKVDPGTVWDYDYELTTPANGKATFKGKARVEKIEKVKVAAGEFDGLLVVETATMEMSTGKGTVSSKTWYAKDVGVVQMKLEVKDPNGKIVKTSFELAGMEN